MFSRPSFGGFSVTRTANSFLELAEQKLATLTHALAVDGQRREHLFHVLDNCLSSWGRSAIGSHPLVLSDITDDHTPFEFSVAFRGAGAIDVRLLLEAQPVTPRIRSRWEAGHQLTESLAKTYGFSLDRFRLVEDVFSPTDEWARFAIWLAANVGQKTSFKIYLNPAAHGAHRATATVREALERLDMSEAWSAVPQLRRGFDEVKYFSLDLDGSADARVKVYFSHRNVGADTIEHMLSHAPGYRAGTATAFCSDLASGRTFFEALPLQTCFSFVGGRIDDVALHFPVRSYAENDAVALARIAALLPESDRERYASILRSFAGRDLAACSGMQTYASFWAKRGCDRVTTYLSPQLYRRAALAS